MENYIILTLQDYKPKNQNEEIIFNRLKSLKKEDESTTSALDALLEPIVIDKNIDIDISDWFRKSKSKYIISIAQFSDIEICQYDKGTITVGNLENLAVYKIEIFLSNFKAKIDNSKKNNYIEPNELWLWRISEDGMECLINNYDIHSITMLKMSQRVNNNNMFFGLAKGKKNAFLFLKKLMNTDTYLCTDLLIGNKEERSQAILKLLDNPCFQKQPHNHNILDSLMQGFQIYPFGSLTEHQLRIHSKRRKFNQEVLVNV